jgi:hypothetical protein
MLCSLILYCNNIVEMLYFLCSTFVTCKHKRQYIYITHVIGLTLKSQKKFKNCIYVRLAEESIAIIVCECLSVCNWDRHRKCTDWLTDALSSKCSYIVRRVWRYQRGNQNPYIEEEQTTQWSKEKVQKNKQRSTKHTYKTKDRVTLTPLKTGGELMCSGRVGLLMFF